MLALFYHLNIYRCKSYDIWNQHFYLSSSKFWSGRSL